MSRLPDIDPATSPDTAAAFERVAASRGWVSNLMRSLAHAPEGLRQYAALGHYGRYGTALSELQRELVIVTTVRGVHYGWTHHGGLARAIGVSEAQLESIRNGRTPVDFEAPERALCDYVLAFTACRGVPQPVLDTLMKFFKPPQIVDIALLSAYYMAAGALIIGLDVEVEGPEMLATELAWQKTRMQAKR
jgi:4-carboxymuconolactone decarboxylase